MGVHLHSWLRRIPVPDKLRLDGKHLFKVGDGPKRWREALDYIESVSPSRIECLNADGDVTRTTAIEVEKPADDESDAKPAKGRDVELARIIMEAGDRGAARHAEAYAMSFGKMTELVQILADRMTGLENAWQDTLERRADELNKAPQGDDDDAAGAMVGNLIQLAAARQNQPAAVGSAAAEVAKHAMKNASLKAANAARAKNKAAKKK